MAVGGAALLGAHARGGSSCHRKDLVADKVQADSIRPRPVKEEPGGRLKSVRSQLVPSVSLSKDALGQALGGVPTVGLLNDFEDQLSHTPIMIRE